MLYDRDIEVWELASPPATHLLAGGCEAVMIFYYRSYNNFTPNYFTPATDLPPLSASIGPRKPRDEDLQSHWRIRQYFITFSINVMAN